MLSNSRAVEIEWGACDPGGIVFNPRYFEFFDWSTALLFQRALGMSKLEMCRTFDSVGIPLVDTRARFLRSSRVGDIVQITSTVTAFRRSSFDVRHELTGDGLLAVEGFETRVWVGRDPQHPDRLKSKPIPAAVIDRFTAAASES